MKYDALTFDTQAVTTNKFDFDGGLLAQLKQFKDGPIDVVVSSVVAREIRKQLAERTRQAADKFDASVKAALHFGLPVEPAVGLTLLTTTPRIFATERVKAFIDAIGGALIPVHLVTIDALMKRYFSPAPPFTGTKKSEFPDAVALMTIEAWAKAEGKRVLAVSGDGDWNSFAEKSSYIDVVTTVEEALTRLQENAAEAEALVQSLLAGIHKDDQGAAKAFKALLEPEVEGYSVDPEVEVSQDAEVEYGEVSLHAFNLAGEVPEFSFKVVRFGSSTLTASVDLALEVTAKAYVAFYQWDSIDKEAVSIGTTLAEQDVEQLPATVLVTWDRDILNDDAWPLRSVEVISIDDPQFGYVEPDWGDNGWDEE